MGDCGLTWKSACSHNVTIPQSALTRSQLPLHKGAFRRRRHEKPLLGGAFTAAVSVQKMPGESLMILYEIDELYDFAVSELAIPIKMV